MEPDGLTTSRWLVAMKGGPGSGKSTVARDLGRELGWPLIDKDDIRPFLDGDDAGGFAYEIMLSVAGRQLDQGLSVLCDSPLLARTYERCREVAAEHGATLVVIEAQCSDETEWARRVEGRKQDDLPEHRTTDWKSVRDFYDDPDKSQYRIETLLYVVDTFGDRDKVAAEVLEWLRDVGVIGAGE